LETEFVPLDTQTDFDREFQRNKSDVEEPIASENIASDQSIEITETSLTPEMTLHIPWWMHLLIALFLG
ncbi:unnamed protein product, partial [Hymenolepis diminuta]